MPSWLNDFEIKGRSITVKATGARLQLDRETIGEFFAWLPFYLSEALRRGLSALLPKQRLKLAYYPVAPRPWYLLSVTARRAGTKTVRDYARADAVFYFEDKTKTPPPQLPGAATVSAKLFNFGCYDISKSRVGEVFEQVFGYPITVDPQTYKGLIAVKSEKNGAHDGYVAEGPLPRKPGWVYQRLVDSSVEGKWGEDLRCPIIGGDIPLIFIKRRPLTKRFANVNTSVTLQTVDDLLSKDEQDGLKRFAAAMGLDCGGMDVLRDKHNGKIYVVDVNKTDMGPPTSLPFKDKNKATKILAARLLRLIQDGN